LFYDLFFVVALLVVFFGFVLIHQWAFLFSVFQNLINLGVNRLVLPAASSVLDTWTTSFGFLPVTQSDRTEFLGYTFLDFQDTVMCQKVLRKLPSPLSHLLRNMPGNRFVPDMKEDFSNLISIYIQLSPCFSHPS